MDRQHTIAWLDDLARQPSVLDEATVLPPVAHRQGINPTCGDRVEFVLHLDGNGLVRVRGTARGCSLSMAAAAVGAEAVEGLEIGAARARLAAAARARLTGTAGDGGSGDLDRLVTLDLVPLRRRCVAFAWQELVALLEAGISTPLEG